MWGRTSKRVAELSAALKQERALREAIERRLTTLEHETSAAWEVLASLVERNEQKRFSLGLKVMLKHEDWPGNNKITRLREAEQKGGRRVSILIGNGGAHYSQLLARGVDGAMTGFAYPDLLVKTYDLFKAGKFDTAEDVFDACLPLIVQDSLKNFNADPKREFVKERDMLHELMQACW